MGRGVGPAQTGFDLRVVAGGQPWQLAFGGNHLSSNPTVICTLGGALEALLRDWPRNFNVPLTILHLGQLLEDRDGSGEVLGGRAAELWDLGAPAPDRATLRRLAWSLRQIASEAGVREDALAEPAIANFLDAEALDRCIVAYCKAEGLWAPRLPQFLALKGEPRYAAIVEAAERYFRAPAAAQRRASLSDVVELARETVARRLAGQEHGGV